MLPEYEMLHTQGKEYIVDDIIKVMKERGVVGRNYHSGCYRLISEGVADMHCMSDKYLVEN